MSVKATAFVTAVSPGTNTGTFQLTISSTLLASGSLANVTADNLAGGIIDSVLSASIVAAVKTYWSLGLLDEVQVLP